MQWLQRLTERPRAQIDLWAAADRAEVHVGELARAVRQRELQVTLDPRGGGSVLLDTAELDAWIAGRTRQ
jgi:hypothetical protein